MKFPATVLSLVFLAAVVFFSTTLLPVSGQAQRGQAPAAPAARGQAPAGRGQAAAANGVPRTPDGKPDLTGIWQVLDLSIDGNIEPHAASWGVHAGQGVIVDPTDGKIPYLPAALARRQENYNNRSKDPVSHCFKPGVPRITYTPFPFQITQTPTWIQMTYEFVHNHRNIYLNGSAHLDGIDFYNGDSRAKWEGDTLVVDVTDLNDDPERPTWLDGSGNYHSDALHVIERYTRTGPDTMTYRATLEDPKVYSKPWTIEVTLYRHKEPNFRILEYECQIFKEKLVREGKSNVLRVVENN